MRIKPSYKPLEITLIKRDKLKKHLREEAGISGTTLAKMSNNKFVSLEVIARICEYLNCNIEDVVEFITDEQDIARRLRSISAEENQLLNEAKLRNESRWSK